MTSLPVADLSNWGTGWWNPSGLMAEELEELDRLLGLECSNPVPGGTIDPRWLINRDGVQINLEEGSRGRGEDIEALNERTQEEVANIETGDLTNSDVPGSEERDNKVRLRTRIRLRLSREDDTIAEGDDGSNLGSSKPRDDQEEEGDQKVTQRDRLGTLLDPSGSHHPRNSFPLRQKRKYTRRQQPETPSSPNLTVASTRNADVELPETPPAPRQKRKYIRRQPTVSTLPEQNSSGFQPLLQEVPSSSRPKRKYTLRQSKLPEFHPNTSPARVKGKYTRRQTQFPDVSQDTQSTPIKRKYIRRQIQLPELPDTMPLPPTRVKRIYTRRHPPATMSLEADTHEQQQQVQSTDPTTPARLKRKYTRRQPDQISFQEDSDSRVDRLSDDTPPRKKRKYTRRQGNVLFPNIHKLPGETLFHTTNSSPMKPPPSQGCTPRTEPSSPSTTFDTPRTKRKYIRRNDPNTTTLSRLRKKYLRGRQNCRKTSKVDEIPRVKRKYVRRVLSRTGEVSELRRSRRILGAPDESISAGEIASPSTASTASTSSTPPNSIPHGNSSPFSYYNNSNVDASDPQLVHRQTSTFITNPTISPFKTPSQPPLSLPGPLNLDSESPSLTASSTPDSISSISPSKIPSDDSPTHHRECSSSLSPAPSDFTRNTPPPKKLHDSVIVRSPLPTPSPSSPPIPPTRRPGRPRKNKESVQTGGMQLDESTSKSEGARESGGEGSNGYVLGAGKSIKSLDRLRRDMHLRETSPESIIEKSGHHELFLRTRTRTRSLPRTDVEVTAVTEGQRGEEWTEVEYARLVSLKQNSRKPLRWLEIASELNRPVKKVKEIWRDRGQWMKLLWNEEKKTRLKELSEEYEMVKWSVIGRVMDIDEEECKIMAREMELI